MTSHVTPIEKFRRKNAHRLRANATGAEARLWKMLRSIPTAGSHFRRQVPIGSYVVDFACLASRLVIEIDGSQHALQDNSARDQVRTEWLEKEGYKVIRFWNSDIVENGAGVLNSIYAALYGSPDSDAPTLKHNRRRKIKSTEVHPTPPAVGGRPSPSRGG